MMKQKNKLFLVTSDMNLMKKILAFTYICSSFVIGCTGGEKIITEGISYVKASSDRPKDCESLGKVNGVSLTDGIGHLAKYEESIKDVKRSVSSVGGNYFHIQKVLKDGAMVSGDAYHCDNF